MTAVLLTGLALVEAAMFAPSGAYLLVVAPLVGLPIALAVYLALRRLCTTRSRRAETTALAGVATLLALAVFGISFGGLVLLAPAILLALAAALTPRRPSRSERAER